MSAMQAVKDPSMDTTQHLLRKWTQYQQQPQAKLLPAPKLPAAARSRIEICAVCQGHRIEKVPYENMVLDRTCVNCDGEGVVVHVRPQEQVPMTKPQEAKGDSQNQQVQSA